MARTHPGGGRAFLFRCAFEVRDARDFQSVRVSADSVYRLWLNGGELGSGPQRSTPARRFFDVHDFSQAVRAGERNVLAIQVVHWGAKGPLYDMTCGPGLLVDGPGMSTGASPQKREVAGRGAKTLGPSTEPKPDSIDERWRCIQDPAFNGDGPPPIPNHAYVAGNWLEDIDASCAPTDWTANDFDDGAWRPARILFGAKDAASPYKLTQRTLPELSEGAWEELPAIEVGTIEIAGAEPPFGYVTSPYDQKLAQPLEVRGGEVLQYFVFDAGRVRAGRLRIELEADAGSVCELMYTEAPSVNGRRSQRDNFEGQRVEGYTDIYRTRGGRQIYEPSSLRSFWYLRLALRGPARIHSVCLADVSYPFEQRGRFECSDGELNRIFEVGLDTCRSCARDTFEDTPYYERLQYLGDARIQALISYVVSGDSRLAENALQQLAESQGLLGLPQARYPSRQAQWIPSFALGWVAMLAEHLLYTGRIEIARQLFGVAENCLEAFTRWESSTGLLTALPGWNFIDWNYPGLGSAAKAEELDVCSSLLYLEALHKGAWLARELKREAWAQAWRKRARKLRHSIAGAAWRERAGYISDAVVQDRFSRHSNALALSEGVLRGGRAQAVVASLGSDSRLRPTSFYFDFHVHRAYLKLRRPDLLLRNMRKWGRMLSMGARTWWETMPTARSDCHAWSATPSFNFLNGILGVRPTAPGFASVQIRPYLAPELNWMRGVVATPRGEIKLEMERGHEMQLSIPKDIKASVVMGDAVHYRLGEGDQVLPIRGK